MSLVEELRFEAGRQTSTVVISLLISAAKRIEELERTPSLPDTVEIENG